MIKTVAFAMAMLAASRAFAAHLNANQRQAGCQILDGAITRQLARFDQNTGYLLPPSVLHKERADASPDRVSPLPRNR
jgi:hypothetical protein